MLDLGLSAGEASRRLAVDGPNELPSPPPPSPVRLFVGQLLNTITGVLAVAAVITTLTGDPASTVVIVAVVVGNATIGLIQQRRAQRALATLATLSAADAEVVRDSRRVRIPASDVVVGDLLSVEAGDIVAADARLVEAAALRLDQATLTGESVPVDKVAGGTCSGTAATDRADAVFRGTAVTQGRGLAVVTATGPHTEVGRIAHLLNTKAPATPLQRRLTVLGRQIAVAAAAMCALVFGLGLARGEPASTMLLAAASLAVAAIPESLPAVVTVALALGAERMARRRAIVRRLLAVETLGSVDVICSDKTGTLTEGAMVVERVWTSASEIQVTGHGYEPEGTFVRDGRTRHPVRLGQDDPAFSLLCRAAALCIDARLVAPDEESRSWSVVGDPTEGALAVLAIKAGDESVAPGVWTRSGELPFDSTRRMMATEHVSPDGTALVSVKGAVEAVLGQAVALTTTAGQKPMTAGRRAAIERQAEAYASAGYRVLALAGRPAQRPGSGQLDGDLAFYGLVAMADPPRPQVLAAVAEARAAGIRPVMITGDHPATATAIARRLGILDGRTVITGDQITSWGVEGLRERVGDVTVFARTSAEQKVDIVRALQDQGVVVAMTGDGVNDAPALHRADIGVAMGRNGTEVAKQAADMVLADDDFATIVTAVREGRRIHDNIRRFVRYGLIGGTAEVWVMLVGPLVGLSLPLLAVQILWINLLTHGIPGVALAVEHPEHGAMVRPPKRRSEQLLDRAMALQIATFGAITAATALSIGVWAKAADRPWQTMVFASLTLLQLGTAVAVRSERRSSLGLGWRGNRFLAIALLATLAAQAIVVFWPPATRLFHTEPLDLVEVMVVVLGSSMTLLAIELDKAIRRYRAHRHPPPS